MLLKHASLLQIRRPIHLSANPFSVKQLRRLRVLLILGQDATLSRSSPEAYEVPTIGRSSMQYCELSKIWVVSIGTLLTQIALLLTF